MKEVIFNKSGNLGALNSFLKNPKNIEYRNFIINNISDEIKEEVLDFKELLYFYLNDIKEISRCACGKKLQYFEGKYRKSCGIEECYKNSRKTSCLKIYGVDNPNKSKDITEKTKLTILEKYNGQHYMKDPIIIEKFKSTMIKNHGVEYSQQNKEIQQKSINTFNKNPNKEEIIKNRNEKLKIICSSEEVRLKREETIFKKYFSKVNYNLYVQNKIKETSLKKYGVYHFLESKEIINKRTKTYIKNKNNQLDYLVGDNYTFISKEYNLNKTDNYFTFNCKLCNNNFIITRGVLFKRCEFNQNLCLHCNPILSGTSLEQIEVYDFIKSLILEFDILENISSIISPKHLDIYIPDLKIAFEYNGLYWHSEIYKHKDYHLEKTNKCRELGIVLIHIFSDDWVFRKNIVKSMISNLLKKNIYKIYARKCVIKNVSSYDSNNFLILNHLQGRVNPKINLGLYYNDKLVSLMTFGNLRIFMNQKSKIGHYELLRFCSLLDTNVIGAANKLFSFFKKSYEFEEIISYCNYSRSTGNIYDILGFTFSHISSPGYFYIKDNIRYNRFGWKKLVHNIENNSEKEIMFKNNFLRLYDCGMMKYIFRK